MIDVSNLKDALKALGFVAYGDIYEKAFSEIGCSLKVDFQAKRLIYPNEIKGRERNDSFDQKENFVVFECVCRLLSKGYRPEHIELEKEWHLGHDAKGGRADICVTDTSGNMLFIIECKTWGREYDKALNNTKSDGAQLFSYWQQEQSCKWLVLYASDLRNDCIAYKAPTIDCSDDANIILLSKKDKSIKLYRDAHTTLAKYEAWKETYGSQIHDDLIFSEDSVAYQIGVKPLRKKDLRDFTPDDKIVNKFEEILRHNNVSDKENAFNRLVALFICKLVDESTKSENDEVEFQYKQGTDTYETLQDRLQRLHRDGMEKFMREEMLYVSADYPEWLFSTYTGSKRKRAIEDLQNTIRILKFYSNNDFAFKDVHNEELFYQNGKILVEMVQLFEKYRIVYPSKHQFLGDLFEQLLNKGFKQNEGQFFTPMPITRFIWDSLPVERIVKSDRGIVYPKVIDYACGAGHFLTEAIEAINYFVQSDGNNAWARDHIYGIEKDYRLARVAKISLFMNGAGEGNIIFGDGLENAPDKGIENGTFDILVANPPYAVKDFKQHLQLKNNSFTLLDRIGMNGGEIETLFVERIAQLLKPQGIAAVILPSSILSNDSASYTGAREQLLQNFYIRGIAAFGSKTFGATGTNTVVMFLEKFNEPPKQIDLSADSVDAVFSGAELAEWKDKDIFEAYLAQIDVSENEYRAFLNKSLSVAVLEGSKYFKMYVTAFADSADAKNLLKTKAYQQKSADEQAAVYLEKLYSYAYSIEREKLFYFSLVYQQTTVIITAPADNKAQKEFLGYDWSNRKGNEGIQIITSGGKMYDDADRVAQGTLAHSIKKSFDGMAPSFNEEQATYASVVNTKNMDLVETAVNNLLDYYSSAVRATKNNIDVIGLQTQIKNCLVLLGYVNISQGLVDKICSFILTQEFREILIDDKILFLDRQLERRKMYSKETSRIVENTLISYLDRNISALKNGERFEVLSRNTGINYCNLVHYIFAPGEKHFSRRLAARVSQIINNNLFQMNRQITQHYCGYVSNNQQKKLITWANKQSRTNFSFDLFEMLVQCDARISKAAKTQLKIFLRQRIDAAQENNNNGIVVYPNKHPYEELDQVGYWCLINVLNAKDFREFLGNSAAFDFYCEYTKFDFNKFDVSWLLNLYPHTLEQIAKNEKVKGCVRVAIADALNDGEIALSDSQRLQSILIKHFC